MYTKVIGLIFTRCSFYPWFFCVEKSCRNKILGIPFNILFTGQSHPNYISTGKIACVQQEVVIIVVSDFLNYGRTAPFWSYLT